MVLLAPFFIFSLSNSITCLLSAYKPFTIKKCSTEFALLNSLIGLSLKSFGYAVKKLQSNWKPEKFRV